MGRAVRLDGAALAHLIRDTDPRYIGAYLDPVHMLADRDQLLMLGNDDLDITDAEAEQLCRDLNEFYQDENWQLQPINAKHWLLRLASSQEFSVSSLQQVLGCNVIEHMPSGPDAAKWRKT